MSSPLHGRVLIVAADAPAERLRRWVASAGEEAIVVAAASAASLERADRSPSEDEAIDLVVTELDTSLPSSLSVLERFLDGELCFGVPQLHVVGDPALRARLAGRNPDIAAMAVGAPSDLGDFRTRVQLAAEIGRLRRELSRSAMLDELTGTYNRRFLTLRLEQELARARRHGNPLSLVLIEIDGFDELVDRCGATIGDRGLAHVVELVRARLRREDVLGRWDGARFAVLLSGTPQPGAAVFAQGLRTALEARPFVPAAADSALRVSAGIASTAATSPVPPSSAELVRAAHRALARAAENGGIGS